MEDMNSQTGIEIELKFPLSISREDFLVQCGESAENAVRIYQKTVMFDNDQKLMEATNGRLRLRTHGDTVTLSYKRPLPSHQTKKEIEWETTVDSWDIGVNIIQAMGFYETTSYEKYRTSFPYKDVKVEIDEYPFATFVEIEGDEDAIKSIATELGFDMSKALQESCDTLFAQWRKERGLSEKNHMRFEDYDI
jgi:adenylate cyclase class 2